MSIINSMKEELKSLGLKNSFFILHTIFCVFFIMAEYGITRPTSNSFFISLCGSSTIPYAYLATVPLNLLIVYLYNRFLPNIGCYKMFGLFCLFIGIGNTFFGFCINNSPIAAFIQSCWKEVYILLMFKQIWSMIHSTIEASKGKYFYGALFGFGSIGAVLGAMLPGFFAVSLGSQQLFFFSAPIYLLIFIFYSLASRQSSLPKKKEDFKEMLLSKGSSSKGGFSLIRKSRFLTFILLLVLFMQLSISLIDFQFSAFLERAIPDLDLRTQYSGRLQSLMNTVTIFFQFLGGILLIRILGLKRSHLLVPIMLCFNAVLFAFIPTFAMISFLFVSIKTMDYCFFSLIREMLYIPLKPDEKFRAKAIIDVFTYRTAKAIGAFILLALQMFFTNVIPLVSSLTIVIFLIWAFCVFTMFKGKEQEYDATIINPS